MARRSSQLLEDKLREIRFWWSQGFNTYEIAKRVPRLSEPQVYNLLDQAVHRIKKPSSKSSPIVLDGRQRASALPRGPLPTSFVDAAMKDGK